MMDLLDNLLGTFNLIDRIEWLASSIRHRSTGRRFVIPRADKPGGRHTLNEVEALLRRYDVPIYGRTHDARCMYFHVKTRQSRWAEYILLRAGVIFVSRPVDPRNRTTAARHSTPPRPWRLR